MLCYKYDNNSLKQLYCLYKEMEIIVLYTANVVWLVERQKKRGGRGSSKMNLPKNERIK